MNRSEDQRLDPIIDILWKYGYFYSDYALIHGLVKESELHLLKRTDSVVQEAIRKYQTVFQPTLQNLMQAYYPPGRVACLDGRVGKATIDLLRSTRCGCPDFVSPERAVEQARFGDQCLEKITTSHNMDLSGISSQELDKIFVQGGKNWEEVLNVSFEYQKDRYPNTHIYAFEAALSGSVLADQMLNVGGCSQNLRGRFDNRNWSVGLLLATLTHEWGHALGWGHVTSDPSAIMYPSIHQAGINRGGKPNSSDIAVMLRLGYTRRTTPPDPGPDPNPDPNPDSKTLFSFTLSTDLPKGTKISLVTNNNDNDGGWKI